MRRILLLCPRTGRAVDTGVTAMRPLLPDYVPRNGHTFCPHCGRIHRWHRDRLVLETLPEDPPAGSTLTS